MTKMTLKVSGMSCDHCVQTIKKALGEVEGIRSVAVDLEKKEVMVDLEDKYADLKTIHSKITEAGFEVNGN